MIHQVTEEEIVAGWEKWGDGTTLKPGFAKWLADGINKPIEIAPPPPLYPLYSEPNWSGLVRESIYFKWLYESWSL